MHSYLSTLAGASCKLVIVGDFNYPDISWHSLTGDSVASKLFCDVVFDGNLSQLVNVPTHAWGNILDLVLTNDEDL